VLVIIALTAATVCIYSPAQNVSMRSQWDLLGWDQDILFGDEDETRDTSVRDQDETQTLRILESVSRPPLSRPKRLDQVHILGLE